MTHVYLMWEPQGRTALERYPSILVAFPDLHKFDGHTDRRMMLDSGAFAAWNSGRVVDLLELASAIGRLGWAESVALDVIGDWRGSKANAIKHKALGSPAMPVFHIGDPWDLLDFYCKHWPKVGLSCRFGETHAESIQFYEGCFARAWPHRFHSFGWTDARALLRFPFHSADSSTWKTVDMYGNIIVKDGNLLHPTRQWTVPNVPSPTKQRYRKHHVQRYLELEEMLKFRWVRELAPLGDWP